MSSQTIFKQLLKQKYFAIATFGFVLWLAETAYFGFNTIPENNVEKTLDFVSALLIGWGIIGDILKGVEIHKKSTTVFNETHNITTQSMDFSPRFDGKPKVEKTDKGIKISPDKGSAK